MAPFLVTLCAALSGVSPSELMIDEEDMTVPTASDPESPTHIRVDLSHHHRVLYTANGSSTNSTGLEPGAVVGISVASVLGVTLLAFAAWWLCIRPRSSANSAQSYAPMPIMPMRQVPSSGMPDSIFANIGEAALESIQRRKQNDAQQDELSGIPLLTIGRGGTVQRV